MRVRLTPWKPVLILAVSLSLTILAAWLSFANAEAKDRVRFENRSQRTGDLIRGRLDANVALLRAAGYFFASKTPGGIRPQDFSAFVERLDLLRSHPGVFRIGYARRDGSRFPIVLSEPAGGLEGHDLQGNSVIASALRRAGESAEPVAFDRPVAPLGDSASGFCMLVPVFRDGVAPQDPASRSDALEGFVFGVFRLDSLLRDLYSGPTQPGIAYEVYSDGALLHRSTGISSDFAHPQFSMTSELTIAGHPWTLRYFTVPPFGEGSTRVQGWGALILGFLASGALFWAAWSQHEATVRLRRSEDNLERRVVERTAQLEAANRELEAFSYSVSHDLRSPLRGIDGFSQMLMDQYAERLDSRGRDYLARVLSGTAEMDALIEGFITLARVSRQEMKADTVDLSAIAEEVVSDLRTREPERNAEVRIQPGLRATGDAGLLRVVLENLLGNAWKFTAKRETATIEVGLQDGSCFVRDNGAGFDMAHSERLFKPFERLHAASDFPGTGVGLATVRRVIERHGWTIRAEAAPDRGATFSFTIGSLRTREAAEVKA